MYERINLGAAVDAPDGLVVPVIHDAQALDLAGISARTSELAARAKAPRVRTSTGPRLVGFTLI